MSGPLFPSKSQSKLLSRDSISVCLQTIPSLSIRQTSGLETTAQLGGSASIWNGGQAVLCQNSLQDTEVSVQCHKWTFFDTKTKQKTFWNKSGLRLILFSLFWKERENFSSLFYALGKVAARIRDVCERDREKREKEKGRLEETGTHNNYNM